MTEKEIRKILNKIIEVQRQTAEMLVKIGEDQEILKEDLQAVGEALLEHIDRN